MILNQDLKFSDLPQKHQTAFSGRSARKLLLKAGTEVYKFSDQPLVHSPRKAGENPYISPWWSAVEPITEQDTGLEKLLERAQGLDVSPATFARARNAVTNQWNSMSGIVIARLRTSVFGFVGGVAHQRVDEGKEYEKVVFIGGAIQLCIPDLAPEHIQKV